MYCGLLVIAKLARSHARRGSLQRCRNIYTYIYTRFVYAKIFCRIFPLPITKHTQHLKMAKFRARCRSHVCIIDFMYLLWISGTKSFWKAEHIQRALSSWSILDHSCLHFEAQPWRVSFRNVASARSSSQMSPTRISSSGKRDLR